MLSIILFDVWYMTQQQEFSGNPIDMLHYQHLTPINDLHYIAGMPTSAKRGDVFDGNYYGRDYLLPCGSPIHSPFNGTVAFFDDIGSNTPMIFLQNNKGVVITILHSDFKGVNRTVRAGDVVGYTASHGKYSTQCHDHISLYVAGKLFDPSYVYDYGQMVNCSLGKCRMSWYTPDVGGINCDDDCSVTADGHDVQELLKESVTYCAAPASVPFGSVVRFEDGNSCVVVDRGGSVIFDGAYWIDILAK